MLKYLCLCLVVNLVLAKTMYNKRSFYFQSEPELDGHLCSKHIFQLMADSPIQCGLFCQTKHSCQSIFFDIDSKTCTGCESRSDENFDVDKVSESTLFYEIRTAYPDATATAVAPTTTSNSTILSPTGNTRFITTNSPVTAEFITKTDSITTVELITTTDSLPTTEFISMTDPLAIPEFITTTDPPATEDFITTTDLPATAKFTSTTDARATAEFITTTVPKAAAEFITTTVPQATAELTTTTDPRSTTEFITTTDRFPTDHWSMERKSTNGDGLQRNLSDDENWTTFNNSMYRILHDVHFYSGMGICKVGDQSTTAHLAWVDGESENEFLVELLNDVRNFPSGRDNMAYLGMQIDAKFELTRFPSGVSQSAIFGTLTRYPSYEMENCVVMLQTGEWRPIECFQVIAAICEVDLN